MISKPEDFDKKWDDMIKDWESKGGTQYIEAMNKAGGGQ